MSIEFYYDEFGFARSRAVGNFKLLADYCISDIQRSYTSCSEMLAVLEMVKSGKLGEWHGNGNAYSVEIYPDKVFIECDYRDNDAAIFSLDEYKAGVEDWERFIKNTTPSEG
ncbi:hypothetical protein [Parachitinimonas caeni]|uniref:Uncharacterized protein n=1 Tax=Parachitinimonas caeni TaxID=3031301 RepID=A0ABT7E3N2_9NEIS|nr:hypothetical protein [Parachitinimonas caeni]MDK2126920.1 hypothetical protein [Parachitinimonas caeni]